MLIALKIYFRRVHFHGLKDIPTDKPIIFTTNHHNSFLDGIILTVLLKQRVHILARGDVFGTPFKKWLLGQFYLLPIYRKSEAANNLEKNQESFRAVNKVLASGHSVLIFPEGVSIQEKRLQRPLKKGFARMAFGAAFESEQKVDLRILPMGINFTRPNTLRSDVIVSTGTPIEISDYKEAFEQSPSAATTRLVKSVEEQLLQQVIIVEKVENDMLAEAALTIARNDLKTSNGWLTKTSERFETEKIICNWINKGIPNAVRKNISLYFKELSALGISDLGLSNYRRPSAILLLLGIPLYVLGWIYRMGLGRRTKALTNKKVRLKEFYSSVYISLGMIIHLIQGIVIITIAGIILGKLGIAIALTWAFTGWMSVYYADHFQFFMQKSKGMRLKKMNPEKWNELMKLRETIKTEFPL